MILHIKELLKQKGITSVELAGKIGVSKTMVSYWLSGKNFPTPDKLESIANALNVPLWQLFVSPDELFEAPASEDATVVCPHCGKPIKLHVGQ